MIEQGEGNTSQGQESYTNKPHEELVQIFRAAIEKDVKRFNGHMSPESAVRFRLRNQYGSDERWEFFNSLSLAWAVLTYERYEPGSWEEMEDGESICFWHGTSGQTAIKLDPLQVKMIDALTEAVGIPHKQGQREIPIPEKLQTYTY